MQLLIGILKVDFKVASGSTVETHFELERYYACASVIRVSWPKPRERDSDNFPLLYLTIFCHIDIGRYPHHLVAYCLPIGLLAAIDKPVRAVGRPSTDTARYRARLSFIYSLFIHLVGRRQRRTRLAVTAR